jgi:hypothetical protein
VAPPRAQKDVPLNSGEASLSEKTTVLKFLKKTRCKKAHDLGHEPLFFRQNYEGKRQFDRHTVPGSGITELKPDFFKNA